jgi:hypothetical protein
VRVQRYGDSGGGTSRLGVSVGSFRAEHLQPEQKQHSSEKGGGFIHRSMQRSLTATREQRIPTTVNLASWPVWPIGSSFRPT